MELQFQKTQESCLQQLGWQVRQLEQTQELKLEDMMPDIGHVLGTWGQVLIRGKEWQNDSVSVSGGVMVWVMYASEEGEDKCVKTWIPFQIRTQITPSERDGTICVAPLLRNGDARSISARKLMVRVNVSLLIQALVPSKAEIGKPDRLPEDVQVLKKTYKACLPKEAGEKAFTIDDDLTLPGNCPALAQLLRFELRPELIDQKIMADKVVFRGVGILHLVYRGQDGQVYSEDLETPFSQYAELDRIYEETAEARITPVLTSLELDPEENGRLHLKAGLLGQYVVYDRPELELIEDAYGTKSQVLPQLEQLQLPLVLDQKEETVNAQLELEAEAMTVADISFYPAHPEISAEGAVTLTGRFCALYYDRDGQLCSGTGKWNGQWDWPADESCALEIDVLPSGTVQSAVSADMLSLNADLRVRATCTGQTGLPMVTGLTVREAQTQERRPGLIIRRLGEDTLWEVAKATGSTVEGILQANGLTETPTPDSFLLIPVK